MATAYNRTQTSNPSRVRLMNLRGLASLAAHRAADTTCDLTYNVLTPLDDGSCAIAPMVMTLKASIHALQPVDIERLQAGGIETQSGVSILLSDALEERPEKLTANGRTWRILTWSFVAAYENESGNPVGTVVAACDEIRVVAAE
jgi:hypothetical protein